MKDHKAISEKLATIEQRTVYYLIAEDGTMTEVTLQEYARTKIGGVFQSDAWKGGW